MRRCGTSVGPRMTNSQAGIKKECRVIRGSIPISQPGIADDSSMLDDDSGPVLVIDGCHWSRRNHPNYERTCVEVSLLSWNH